MKLLRRRVPPGTVTLVTRQGCHLCEEVGPVVERLAEEAGVPFASLDVDLDPADVAAYGEKVPVVLLDGTLFTYGRVDETALRRALRG